MRRSSLIALFTLLAASLVALPVQARDLTFGGASITGVYYQVAQHGCRLLEQHKDDYNCVGRPTQGSVFNINALSQGSIDFGVAQSDRAWQAINGEAEWERRGAFEELRSLFAMHPETVMLVVRADSDIHSVEDIQGHTINIGNPGSGQRRNAMDVLEIYGIDPRDDIRARNLQQHEASRALVDGQVDGFFYTVGNPSAAIEEPANSVDIRMIPINSDAIREFVEERPYYVMTAIPGGTYPGVDEDIETYAVTATVVTHADMDEDVVYDLTAAVFEQMDDLRNAHAAFRHLEPEAMMEGVSVDLHPGALRYFEEQGWR